ncbi:MAG: hypothetical protein AAB116_15460 [Candidatus Poribacteria bacterium]
MKKHLIIVALLVVMLLILTLFCSCAPYAKINELEPKMSIKKTVELLGSPSDILFSDSSFLPNGFFLSCKVYRYSYLDTDYYLLFMNEKLCYWGTSQEGVIDYMKALIDNLKQRSNINKEGKIVLPVPSGEIEQKKNPTIQEEISNYPVLPYKNPGGKHWIISNSGNGSILTLEDSSVWEIQPVNHADTCSWVPATNIVVSNSNNPLYPYKLINVSNHKTAEAKLLSQ